MEVPMIYITAKTMRVVQSSNFAELQAQAMQALLNQTLFEEELTDDISYQATVTHMQSLETIQERRNEQVQSNFVTQQDRITNEINKFYSLGVHPEDSYEQFFIPKKAGGSREINAPSDELTIAHRNILHYLGNMQVLTHDAAFAYTKHRSTVDALKRHQMNKSQWFLKLDLKNFFPNCTEGLLKNTLTSIYPFNFMDTQVLDHIIGVSMLNGGLPQGSPLSPLLSNLVMVPFDYHVTKELWDYKKQHFVYTRYADDIIISSKYSFSFTDVVDEVTRLLNQFLPGHSINEKKTHYGSRSGRNWNLGLMLNKDNNITIGHKKKQNIRAMLHQMMIQFTPAVTVRTTRHTVARTSRVVEQSPPTTPPTITHDEAYYIIGMVEYAKNIEPEYWVDVIQRLEAKLNIKYSDVRKLAVGDLL